MNRRDVLRRTIALAGVGTLAGCLNNGGNGDDGSDGDGGSGTTTEPPTPSIADQSVATRSANCLSEDGGEASVSTDSLTVTVAGTIEAPDPCHEATIADASYDGDADTLVLTVGTESDGSAVCQDCVGGVEYEATVTFDGALPASATVDHEGSEGTTTVVKTDL